jgi:hypothetical protein
MIRFTEAQREILLFGETRLAGRGFEDELERWLAWCENRSTLMTESRASRRPHAYLDFEVRNPTRRFCATVEFLRRAEDPAWRQRNPAQAHLFEPVPSVASEGLTTLSPRQPPDFLEQFCHVAGVEASGLALSQIENVAAEFLFAQAWHAFRGRDELASKYSQLGHTVRLYLAGALRTLTPQSVAPALCAS